MRFPWKWIDNPSNIFYIGGSITKGIFKRSNGSYVDINTGKTSSLKLFQFKRWNFYNFNK
jgi:hypothetical protein